MTTPPTFPDARRPGLERPQEADVLDPARPSHVSGREVRDARYLNPIWRFELTFDGLDGAPAAAYGGLGAQSLQALMGFFLQCAGAIRRVSARLTPPTTPSPIRRSGNGRRRDDRIHIPTHARRLQRAGRLGDQHELCAAQRRLRAAGRHAGALGLRLFRRSPAVRSRAPPTTPASPMSPPRVRRRRAPSASLAVGGEQSSEGHVARHGAGRYRLQRLCPHVGNVLALQNATPIAIGDELDGADIRPRGGGQRRRSANTTGYTVTAPNTLTFTAERRRLASSITATFAYAFLCRFDERRSRFRAIHVEPLARAKRHVPEPARAMKSTIDGGARGHQRREGGAGRDPGIRRMLHLHVGDRRRAHLDQCRPARHVQWRDILGGRPARLRPQIQGQRRPCGRQAANHAFAARPTDLISGSPVLNAIRQGAFDGATVQRDRVFLSRHRRRGDRRRHAVSRTGLDGGQRWAHVRLRSRWRATSSFSTMTCREISIRRRAFIRSTIPAAA